MRLIFYRRREALSNPQVAPPWFTGSVPSDDSQFFATPEIDPNLPESMCPANLNDWRGSSLFKTEIGTTFAREPLLFAVLTAQ